MKTHRLFGLVCDLGLYDEKVDIAVRTRRTTSVRAKQNDLGIRRGSSQTMSRLGDQSLIDCSHDQIVNLAADNSYHASMARKRIKGAARGRPATHLVALVANGTVRRSEGPRYLPTPMKLRGAGRSAASYVVEGRR